MFLSSSKNNFSELTLCFFICAFLTYQIDDEIDVNANTFTSCQLLSCNAYPVLSSSLPLGYGSQSDMGLR